MCWKVELHLVVLKTWCTNNHYLYILLFADSFTMKGHLITIRGTVLFWVFFAWGTDCTFDYSISFTTLNIKINKVSNLILVVCCPACRHLYSHNLRGLLVQTFHHLCIAALSHSCNKLIFSGESTGTRLFGFSRCHFSLTMLKQNRWKEEKWKATFIPFEHNHVLDIVLQILYIYIATIHWFLPCQQLDLTKHVRSLF